MLPRRVRGARAGADAAGRRGGGGGDAPGPPPPRTPRRRFGRSDAYGQALESTPGTFC